MEKRISYSQFQSVKAVAKACNPIMVQREKLKTKIDALIQEYKALDEQVRSLEAGIVNTLGFRVEQLVKKVIEPTGSTDPKTGKPIKVTKYLPTDIVSYDEQKKQYVVVIPDTPAPQDTTEPQQSHESHESQESQEPTEAPATDDDNLPFE